jgi:hypothetical protein
VQCEFTTGPAKQSDPEAAEVRLPSVHSRTFVSMHRKPLVILGPGLMMMNLSSLQGFRGVPHKAATLQIRSILGVHPVLHLRALSVQDVPSKNSV